MLLKLRIKRLRNMASEWLRLTRVRLLSWDSIRIHWRMYGLNSKASGMSFRELELVYLSPVAPNRYSEGHNSDFPRGFTSRTETIKIKRDYLDVVLDFIADYVRNFYRNIFVTARCSHPHYDVRQEWDGDEEVGYVQQHRCRRCSDYISGNDIDQYLPEHERRPDLIHLEPKPFLMEDESINDDGYDPRYEYDEFYD